MVWVKFVLILRIGLKCSKDVREVPVLHPHHWVYGYCHQILALESVRLFALTWNLMAHLVGPKNWIVNLMNPIDWKFLLGQPLRGQRSHISSIWSVNTFYSGTHLDKRNGQKAIKQPISERLFILTLVEVIFFCLMMIFWNLIFEIFYRRHNLD